MHIDWDAQPLGKMPVAALAKKLSIGNSSVHYQHKKRGIPVFTGRVHVDWDAQPLGRVTDHDLAQTLGVVYRRVSRARKERGIPPFASFIAWWNASHKHSGRGMEGRTPDQVFEATWAKKREVPAPVIRLLFAEKIPGRKVRANGVRVDGLDYYSSELWEHKGRSVTVRRPVRDIGEVYIYDLKGKYLCSARNDALVATGVTAMDIRAVAKARKAERAKLQAAYGWLKSYQAFMPTMEQHLINHARAEGRIKQPEAVEQVVGLDLPPETRREQFAVVKDNEPKPKRKLEMLY